MTRQTMLKNHCRYLVRNTCVKKFMSEGDLQRTEERVLSKRRTKVNIKRSALNFHNYLGQCSMIRVKTSLLLVKCFYTCSLAVLLKFNSRRRKMFSSAHKYDSADLPSPLGGWYAANL